MQNDVLAAILNQRVVRRLEEVHMTCAPAMDIQVPYNVERLFYMATMGDTAQLGELMAALRNGSQAAVPEHIADYFARHGFIAATTTDAAVKHTMRQTAAQGRLQDPHTSVGVHAALDAIQQDASVLPMVCMGCAHPVKFLTTVAEAIGSAGDESADVPAALDLGAVSVLPDVDSNPHVSELLALLQEKASNEHGALRPQRVFRRGEDWAQSLLDLLKDL
jgi:threonine synthase